MAGITSILLFIWFAATSIRERRFRASAIALILASACALVWLVAFNHTSLRIAISVIALLFAMAFFLPLGRNHDMMIADTGEKVDERDTMFAREEYMPGTPKYDEYYRLRPENRETDDKIRGLPELLAPGGRYYDPIISPYIDSIFAMVRDLARNVDGDSAQRPREIEAGEITAKIKSIISGMGAADVGVAELNQAYAYSHVGRGPEPWGSPITNNHRYVIAFSLEMDYFRVEQAPRISITMETAINYLKGADISLVVADFIRKMGYPARAHMSGSNYQLMLPPVAYDAGLGEIGRMGYLISPSLGPRVRLGAVSTDLPLVPDGPEVFGVQDFCERCRKCAINCPAGAIPSGDRTVVRGVEKWQINIEKCFRHWRVIGTDCGICMKVCPYSHPDTFVHNIVRSGVRRSSFARWISLYADDIFYGRKVG